MQRVNLDDFETEARQCLPPAYFDYFAGGANDEITLQENRDAFARLKLRPRVLSGSADPEASGLVADLLGHRLVLPVLLAPTAFHKLLHADGECATARAACAAGTVMVISMASTTAIEEIVDSVPAAERSNRFWFQLYIQPDRGFTHELVRRAEQAGCAAIVVTADSPVFGRRERDLRHRFVDLPVGLRCENMHRRCSREPVAIAFDPTLSWKDIDWLRNATDLPVLIKGVAHPDDACIAIEHGLDALIVSNHGGRQLDTTAAAIDLLPDITRAVEGRIPVIVDGGIRRGTDVLKAIALGAAATAIGRPAMWGLAVAGETGVHDVLQTLEQELADAMKLCGCSSLAEVSDDILFRP